MYTTVNLAVETYSGHPCRKRPSIWEKSSDTEQLAKDGRLKCGMRDSVSASRISSGDEQYNRIAERRGALPRWDHLRRWETGIVEAGTERRIMDEGLGPETQRIWGRGDGLLYWYTPCTSTQVHHQSIIEQYLTAKVWFSTWPAQKVWGVWWGLWDADRSRGKPRFSFCLWGVQSSV